MLLSKIISALQEIAPLEHAEPWDNVGLLIGDPAQTIRSTLVTIDYTADVAAEAARIAPGARSFVQVERKGTAHAVLAARDAMSRRKPGAAAPGQGSWREHPPCARRRRAAFPGPRRPWPNRGRIPRS